MVDSSKTKKELIAELEALRAKLRAPADEPPLDGDAPGVTRRDLLESAWVAPVVLSVPLAVGALGVSHNAAAQPPEPATTPAPTLSPTTTPTTPAPTMGVGPGPAPTPLPTSAPTASAPPTAFPTAAPGVIPVEISNFDIS